MDRLAQSCSLISKRELLRKKNDPRKQTKLDSPLLLPNNARPHQAQDEVNNLAKAWCELVLGQILETHHNQAPRAISE